MMTGTAMSYSAGNFAQAEGRMKRSSIEDLDADQRAALMTFRLQNGRDWKPKLLDGWQASRFPGPLQQIRNAFGPAWLLGLQHVPDYRLNIALMTADKCEGKYCVVLDPSGRPAMSRITWSPDEPDAQTDSVTLDLYDGDELKKSYVVSGDYWRELEDGELNEDLWRRILTGEDLEGAVEAMPVCDNRPHM